MSRLFRVAAACFVMLGSPGAARPFTIDDLLNIESLGGAYLSPDSRWLIVEHTKPYDSGNGYDSDGFEPMSRSRLDLVDLQGAGTAVPLVAGAEGDGVNPGPFSPDGQRMVVFRLRGHSWELGIATLATREVRWLGLTVEPSNWGRSVQWRSNQELVAIALADGDQPARFNWYWAAQDRPPARWAQQRAGRVATATLVGSGRFADLTPRGPRTNLVRITAAKGAAQILASGSFIDLEVAPSGRFVAALGEDDFVQPKVGDALRTGTMPRRRTLTLINLETGATLRPCGNLDLASHLLAWSRGRERLLVYGRADGADWAAGDLRTVEAGTGLCSRLSIPGARPAVVYDMSGYPMIRADWLGSDAVVYSEAEGASPGGRRDWRRLTASRVVVLTADLKVPPPTLLAISTTGVLLANAEGSWAIDPQGRARRLNESFKRPVISSGPGDGDRMAYVAAKGTSVWLSDGRAIANLSAAGLSPARDLPPDALPLAASDTVVVSQVTDAHGVGSVILQKDGAQRRLMQINAGYADVSFSDVTPVDYVDPKGEALKAWLYMPADPPADVKLPLVVIPYPGQVHPTAPRSYAAGFPMLQLNPHILTAAGYAVLIPSMPRDPNSHDPAAGLAEEALAAVDAAAKVAPLDTERMAVWGHSFGGYAALAIATQTSRFKSVVDSDGPADLISDYGSYAPAARSAPEDGFSPNLSMGWAEHGQGNLGVRPPEDLERYARNSPVLNADKITASVLMIHGDLDFVPLGQSEEMYSALYRQQKDAALMTLWGEGHEAVSPANVRAMYERILWWLKETLPPTSSGERRRPD